MIQRIQTIWLLLASITIACLFFIPTVSSSDGTVAYQIFASGIYKVSNGESTRIQSFIPLTISTIAVAAICIVNIFNFRKRTAQKRVILASIALITGLLFWNNVYAKQIPGVSESVSYGVGAFLPAMAILFCVLAFRGIVADEKLLKSADRLR